LEEHLLNLPGFFGNTKPGDLSTPVESNEHIKGSIEAPITIVEYSDFQCPACLAFFPVVKAITESEDKNIRFVYRHFPLSQIHPRAEASAIAAEAAALQGKFFEMHDILFENQEEWAKGNEKASFYFKKYATEIGLDVEQFENDLNREDLKSEVQKDYATGISSNVTGTPSFYLNGKKLEVRSIQEFQQAIIGSLENLNKNQVEESQTATTSKIQATTTGESI